MPVQFPRSVSLVSGVYKNEVSAMHNMRVIRRIQYFNPSLLPSGLFNYSFSTAEVQDRRLLRQLLMVVWKNVEGNYVA
jgi:hypothetical protein